MSKEQITVELLSSDLSDAAIVNAARVSFAGEGFWHELPEDYKGDPNKLINYLAVHKHTTPFRHNSITIRAKAPIFIARQLGKHQAGLSWNEVSRRYVDKDFEFFTPSEWRSRPDGGIKQGSGDKHVKRIEHSSGKLVDVNLAYTNVIDHAIEVYESMIKSGVAPEMARMVLPQSMQTEWVWTGNLLAFAHVYNLRKDGHAQVEAQWFADALDEAIKDIAPIAWKALTGK